MVLARSQKPGTVPYANLCFPRAAFTSEFRVVITSVSLQFIFPITTPNVSVVTAELRNFQELPMSHWIKFNLWTEFWEGWGNAFGKGSNILCATICEQRPHPVMPALDPPGAKQLSSWNWSILSIFFKEPDFGFYYFLLLFFLFQFHLFLLSYWWFPSFLPLG